MLNNVLLLKLFSLFIHSKCEPIDASCVFCPLILMKPLPITLLALSVIFFVLNFINYDINQNYPEGAVTIKEEFDPALGRLNTLKKLTSYVDSNSAIQNIKHGSLEYAIEANNIVQKRFYHGYSTFSLNENWIASVLEKCSWIYFSSRVKPDDILEKPYAFCSQQATVLMELLQSKNLDCRAVKWPGHFTMQCRIDGKWNYFDPNLEPDILPEQRSNEKWLVNRDSLAVAYKKVTAIKEQYGYKNNFIDSTFGNPIKVEYGEINVVQAPYTRLSQKITRPLSKIAFIFPLLLFVYLKRRNGKSKNPAKELMVKNK